jgi:sugar O-acyltransferase (sialic acid O-acetyltransferase NeuD family)
MKINNSLLLIGGGGHCKSVLDTILSNPVQWKNIYIVDSTIVKGAFVNGYQVIGGDNDLESLHLKGFKFAFISIGGIDSYKIRNKIYNRLKFLGYSLPVIIDKSAYVSNFAILSEGVFVGKKAIVNIDSVIGKCAILNTSSIVEHDCVVGDFSHISTSTILNGGVIIGDGTFIGSNSVLKNGIHIGNNSVIGMGSNVLKNLPANITAFGNPCEVIK